MDSHRDNDNDEDAPDPRAIYECAWRGCTACHIDTPDDPPVGWSQVSRNWVWLRAGDYCPEHHAMIEQAVASGAADDWPLDVSDEVLDLVEDCGPYEVHFPRGDRRKCRVLLKELIRKNEEDIFKDGR